MTDELDLVRRLRSEADIDPSAVSRVRRSLLSHVESHSPVANMAGPPGARIVPYLIYDDVGRALRWLMDAFGFAEQEDERLVDAEGVVQRAAVELHGSLVTLGPPWGHGASPRLGVSSMLEVDVADIDDHYRRAMAAGAQVVIGLEDTPWGARRYQVRDLEGHQWHFSQPTAAR